MEGSRIRGRYGVFFLSGNAAFDAVRNRGIVAQSDRGDINPEHVSRQLLSR
jgi:hypothetical protein